MQPDWEAQFQLLGSILGFAIKYGEQVPIRFCRRFVTEVLQRSRPAESCDVSLASSDFHREGELRQVDVTLANKLKCLMRGEYMQIWAVETLSEALVAAHLPPVFVAEKSKDVELTGITELAPNGL